MKFNPLCLAALLAPATAYQLAAPALFRARAAVRMQEEATPAEEAAAPVEEAAPVSSGPLDRTSPLAGIVGESNLEEFQKKKPKNAAKKS